MVSRFHGNDTVLISLVKFGLVSSCQQNQISPSGRNDLKEPHCYSLLAQITSDRVSLSFSKLNFNR